MPKGMYIRLSDQEWVQLLAKASEDRRDPNDEAAFLVSQGLARWQAQKDFERSLPPTVDAEGDAA